MRISVGGADGLRAIISPAMAVVLLINSGVKRVPLEHINIKWRNGIGKAGRCASDVLILDTSRDEWDFGELTLFEQLMRRSRNQIAINTRRKDEPVESSAPFILHGRGTG